jgi:heme ABC exporter ATP-binding subunit CcmA
VRVPSRVISLRSAVCLLGRFPALAGADLAVDAGEIVLLSGPNGAGKTTLLRLCAGLLPLRAGHAEVLGHDLARDRRAVRRAIGLVGHETYAYDDLSVVENLRFATRAAGRDRGAADAALVRVGLADLANVVHSRLSQGQRRRVSLAVALARDPELLLLDEPHAGLDAEGRAVVDDVLTAAPGEGRTVLLASHEVEMARELATREVQVIAGQVRGGESPVPEPRVVEVVP